MIFSAAALVALSLSLGVGQSAPMVVETPSPAFTTLNDFFPSCSLNIPILQSTADGTWGDSIHEHPGELHRIYFQNVDGIRNDSDEVDHYVSCMAQYNVSTFCWADPGLALSQPSVQQRFARPIRSHFSTMRCAFSSSDISSVSTTSRSMYQPGGTYMATTGKWATRSTGKPLVDPLGLGCWSGLTFLGKNGKRLSVITAYQSPRQQPTGGFGFFDQQHALLLSKGVKKPNVRKQFVSDIVRFIREAISVNPK